MIQQGVSVGDIGGASSSSHDPEGGRMTIGKIMDWIEARLDAIKSREEEEDGDEEKEKEKEHERARRSPPPNTTQPPPSVPRAAFTVSSTSMPTPTPNPSIHSFPINDISAGAKRHHAVMMLLDSASPTVAIANPLQSGTSHAHPPLSPCSNVPGHHGTTGAGGTRRRTQSSRGTHQLPHQREPVGGGNGRAGGWGSGTETCRETVMSTIITHSPSSLILLPLLKSLFGLPDIRENSVHY